MSMRIAPSRGELAMGPARAIDSESMAQRLDFMQFTDKDRSALRRLAPIIAETLDDVLDRFYAKVKVTPQISGFFTTDEQIARAKAAQIDHWNAICSADFSAGYAARVHRIGTIHARIGLEPRWYLGGYAVVAEALIHATMAGRFQSRKQTAANIAALVKALLLDIELSVTAYQDVTDHEVVHKIGDGLSRLADGDLSHEVSGVTARFEGLQSHFNDATRRLRESLRHVSQAAHHVDVCAGELKAASEDLGRRTEMQASSLEEASARIQEIAATTRATAASAIVVREGVAMSVGELEAGQHVITRTIAAINAMAQSSDRISGVVGMIEDIAFQTNMLALNAGIEAARAGEAGKGFTLVAQEVRGLAKRATDATRTIKDIIEEGAAQAGDGVLLVTETGTQFDRISEGVDAINGQVHGISASASSQAERLDHMSNAIIDMDRITQQNAALVEQASAAARQLAEHARELASQVSRFHITNILEETP